MMIDWVGFIDRTKGYYTYIAEDYLHSVEDAEDAVQIAYMKIYQAGYPEAGIFAACEIAVRREATNTLRYRGRKYRPTKKDLVIIDDRLRIKYNTQDGFNSQSGIDAIYDGIQRVLTEKEHSIITAWISGFNYSEIAKMHNHAHSTIKIYMHGIRNKLRKHFPEYSNYFNN